MTKTRIQMYEKNRHTNTHTNVWEKHSCKCMTKTRVQNSIQMYDKNPHTNVWKKTRIQMYDKNSYKIAYKCMKKTRIQMYDKNTRTKSHTNVWQKPAFKCMKKNRHTNVWKKYTHILELWTANYSAHGAWGALLKGTSAVTRRWTATPPAVCPPILLLISEWGLNRQLSGYWKTTLTTAPRQTQIQM